MPSIWVFVSVHFVTAESCPQATNHFQWTAGCEILETVFPLER